MNSDLFSREPAYEEKHFIGRHAILTWIAGRLSSASPQNINVVGEPRIGKTSTLYQAYARRLGLHASWHGVYVWLPATELPVRTPQTFWREMRSRLERDLPAELSQPLRASVGDAPEEFDEFQERLERLIEENGIERIIYFIDDFDLLVPSLETRDLDWLRAIITRFRQQFAFVIGSAASIKDLTKELPQQAVSPFHNVFSARTLGLLEREEAVELLQKAVDAAGLKPLPGKHITFLLAEAGRHPALLRIISEYFIDASQAHPASLEDEKLYDDVRADFRYDSHVLGLFDLLTSRRQDAEKEALLRLAQGREVMDMHLLHHLAKHVGLVEQKGERYALFSDAYRDWLLKYGAEMQESKEVMEKTPASAQEELPLLYYDPAKRQVQIGDRLPVRLTKLENRLISYMIERVDEVCSPKQLLEHVWGGARSQAVVEKTINRLRPKLEPDEAFPRYLISVRGQGYMLQNSKKV